MDELNQVKGFHSTFHSFGKGGCDPLDWEHHFLKYDISDWLSEGDGVLQFFSDDKRRYSLVIIHVPGRGFVLQYDCWDIGLNKNMFCCYAVSDKLQLTHFEEVGDELFYPSGCLLSPQVAWSAVKGFLCCPTMLPEDVVWVADQDISWQEQ